MLLTENQPLAPLTTLGVGGRARWFVEATTESDVEEAVAWAANRNLELFVLGGGSNLLVSDAGFNGLVLKICIPVLEMAESAGGQFQTMRAGAGVSWDHCVERSLELNCAGIECLAGIPGTVGGTPVQNVGAYGQEVATVIDRVRAFDRSSRAFAELTAAECGFSYRRSRFNSEDRNRFIVTRVDYLLKLNGASTVRYPELEAAVERNRKVSDAPSLAEVADAVRRIRRSKGMVLVESDPDSRSAGSFFKNPVVSKEHYKSIAARSSGPPGFPVGPSGVKIPAAWLIEQAGFNKGYALGAAGISSKHTLALMNRGGATAAEIVALADRIREGVRTHFRIELEMEPVMLGF